MTGESSFLEGKDIVMMPLGKGDINSEYLSWLNDAAVLRYRAPKSFPTTLAQLEEWIVSLPSRGDLVLAIRTRTERRHVGNIALNTILWPHRSAELSIMIGAKDVWGQGIAKDAIEVLTAHAFGAMGLHRLWSESPNPAFNGVVAKLGWTKEGIKRDGFMLDGAFVDIGCWSILDHERRSGGGRTS